MDVAYEINFDIDGFLRSFELQRRAGRGDADRRAAGDRASEQIERRFGAERRARRAEIELA